MLERFGVLPLNAQTKKLLAFHRHPGAKRVEKGGRKVHSHYWTDAHDPPDRGRGGQGSRRTGVAPD